MQIVIGSKMKVIGLLIAALAVLNSCSALKCYSGTVEIDADCTGRREDCMTDPGKQYVVVDCRGSCVTIEEKFGGKVMLTKECDPQPHEEQHLQKDERRIWYCSSDYCNTGSLASPGCLLLFLVVLVHLIQDRAY